MHVFLGALRVNTKFKLKCYNSMEYTPVQYSSVGLETVISLFVIRPFLTHDSFQVMFLLCFSVLCTVESLSLLYLLFISDLYVLGDDALIS